MMPNNESHNCAFNQSMCLLSGCLFHPTEKSVIYTDIEKNMLYCSVAGILFRNTPLAHSLPGNSSTILGTVCFVQVRIDLVTVCPNVNPQRGEIS